VVSRCRFVVAVLSASVVAAPSSSTHLTSREPGSGTVTLIQIGDIHGHLVSRADARRANAARVGGLAQVATVVDRIRRERGGQALLVNVGDAVQGSAEALFTSGQAVVDVLSHLRIDAFVPGNWDYVYGIDRFVETFVGMRGRGPLAPWPTIASNLYYATPDAGMRTAYVDVTGERVLPPFVVRDVGGVRVGTIGITTTRGPRALGKESTRGFMFTAGDSELRSLVRQLRDREHVDVVVVGSELELANNIRVAKETDGIDVILSADMHELTRDPIVVDGRTVITEVGQDGAAVGELSLTVRDGAVAHWSWRLHEVTDTIPDDPAVARAVSRARAPFISRTFERNRINPINGARLRAPIDQVVGYTRVALHRANPSDESVPAVLEGSSHDFLADAVRSATGADIALVRGFRFGTHVRPGPITREDLYHFLPVGAQVARADGVPGLVIWRQLESSVGGALDPDPRQWTGGWMVGTSGLTVDIDPYRRAGERVRQVRVRGESLDTTGVRRYSVAGLWFPSEADAVSNCGLCATLASGLSLTRARNGGVDAVDVVADYVASSPDSTVAPGLGRVRLMRMLPKPEHPFPSLQPLGGVRADSGTAGQNASLTRH